MNKMNIKKQTVNDKLLLITILIIASLMSFGLNIKAQTVNNPPKPLTQQEKTDKREIIKFGDSFVRSFINIKDLDKMPKYFFDDNFKNWFSKSNFNIYPNQNKTSNNQELYQRNILFANFFNLLITTISQNIKKDIKDEDLDTQDFFVKSLPPNILNKFKQSKWMKSIFVNDNVENYPENESDWENCITDFKAGTKELQLFLTKHPIKLSKSFIKLKIGSFKYYPSEKCEGEDCFGLPEQTPIFAIHELLFCLRIARINGQLKIVQIYSVIAED
jgi:hypothetical protein